ncbi:hypothetical protein ERO13_D05G051400v2 [Gossypium hirsutum]|nr:hypothetical protein ERO13_D05G051400v2 [Gossypium hirsutum]
MAGSGDGGNEREVLEDSINHSSSFSRHRYRRSMSSGEEDKGLLAFSGWVYHVGTNSIGHEYSHQRFLYVKGKYVEMYRRDPQENPGIRPIRKGIIGPTLMVEETGSRKVGNEELYTIQFYNRLDETKKGEIACTSAEESKKWIEALDYAKQQAEYELSRGGGARNKLSLEADIDLEGHRPRVRRYASGLKKLIRIGGGPELLSRSSSSLGTGSSDGDFEGEFGDAVEAHEWKCVRTINGVRILEDVADGKGGKASLVKAVAPVDASADTVLEVILNLDRHKRYEWDMLTGDLELVDSYDGNYDVVYGTYDPKYLGRWQSKRDFVFSRQWFQGQDGAYTILQFPAAHKKRPTRNGYQRTSIKPSTWEIRSLTNEKCLVTHMLEMNAAGWGRWKKSSSCSKFEKTIPFALLSQVAGLKEYIGANPSLKCEPSSLALHSKHSEGDPPDEFYDAVAGDSSSTSEDEESDDESEKEEKPIKQKPAPAAISSTALKQASDAAENARKDDADTNCWTSPGGAGFMIRGQTYLKNSAKIMGGKPLLKLIAVDWFKVDKATDKIALHPKSLAQIPAKPNYSLVLYHAAERPVRKDSLLEKFADGTDQFRDARFKLIPSIVEGYWMVKRAVGTKACLLGKAVTCKYFRQDNFLEIDVDIGSSSVARSVIGLVLGYVTSLVVDLAILIEANDAAELPEYILGSVRLNRVRLESAVPLDG